MKIMIYACVFLIFALILFRKQFAPYLKRKEKKEKLLEAQHIREVSLPCYRVLAFRSTDYLTMHEFARDVEYKLGQSLEEIADKGGDPPGRIEYMSAGNVLLVLLRCQDKRILYPASQAVQKEGESK